MRTDASAHPGVSDVLAAAAGPGGPAAGLASPTADADSPHLARPRHRW